MAKANSTARRSRSAKRKGSVAASPSAGRAPDAIAFLEQDAARKAELEGGSIPPRRNTTSLSARAQTSAKNLVASVAKAAGPLRG